MGWIEAGSWVMAALLLAGLHLSIRRARRLRSWPVFVSAVVASLLGGYFVRILRVPLAAGVFAEVAIRMEDASRLPD